MIKNTKAILFLLVVTILVPLVPVKAALSQKGKPLNVTALRTGMNMGQVQELLGRKPDAIIATQRQAGQLIEVLQYSKRHRGTRTERYWLYFENDQLYKLEKPKKNGRPDP